MYKSLKMKQSYELRLIQFFIIFKLFIKKIECSYEKSQKSCE